MIVIQHSKPAGGVTGSGPDFSAPFEGAKQELAAALTEQVLEVDNAAKYAEVNALNPLTDRNYDKADVIAKYLRDKYRVVSLVFQEYVGSCPFPPLRLLTVSLALALAGTTTCPSPPLPTRCRSTAAATTSCSASSTAASRCRTAPSSR